MINIILSYERRVMTDLQREKLSTLIDASGYRKRYIYNRLGLSKEGFRQKMQGRSAFNMHHITILKELLKLTDEQTAQLFYE